jgi:hypothetical protein
VAAAREVAAVLRDMQACKHVHRAGLEALLADLRASAHRRTRRPHAGPGTAGHVLMAFESALAGALFPDAVRHLF